MTQPSANDAPRRRAPGTGEALSSVPMVDREAALAAIQRARRAQVGWAALSLAERCRVLGRVSWLMVERNEALEALISAEVGRPRFEALAFEILPTLLALRWYRSQARRALRPERIYAGHPALINKRSTVHRLPWGVVGVIAPWNYPLGIPMHEIIPALIAGNAVVFKSAPETVGVGAAMERLFADAGLPEGLFQHLNMDGPEAGEAFLDVEGAGVDKLFFTGSGRVGQLLMERAAQTLTPVSLELGSNDPMIVCADADIERAARGAIWGGITNCGQACASVERVYVEAPVYEAFLARASEHLRALRVGAHDRDHGRDVGPLCTERQAVIVRSHLDDALDRGARIHAQTELPDGLDDPRFIAPTLLTGVDHSMRIMREETFGPVIAVMQVRDLDEAVMLANDSELGLTASVWTRDRQRGRELARRLQSATVMLNDHVMSHGIPALPWGGMKRSGIGRGHGRYAFEAVTQPQLVVEERFGFLRRDAWWYPYDGAAYRGMRGMQDALAGRGLWRRLRGLARFLALVPRLLRP